MTKKYDVVVYIGRFQPFHNAHLETILAGLEVADKVVVVIGSANEPRTYFRNPFTVQEREFMIRQGLSGHGRLQDVLFTSVENNPSDAAWAADVVQKVENVASGTLDTICDRQLRIAKIGFVKDAGVQRDLDLFPQWPYVEHKKEQDLDATQIRNVLFGGMGLQFLEGVCPKNVIRFLGDFTYSEQFKQLMREKKYIEDYKQQFNGLRYAPTFVTADAILIQSGHVLLIERKAEPGKGLWAVPGGFLNAATDKSVFEAALRELSEETKVKVADRVLRKSFKGVRVFDAIDRSARGRTITHAHVFVLDDGFDLPKTKASDDAAKTKWVHINDIKREMMFEDHDELVKWGWSVATANEVK